MRMRMPRVRWRSGVDIFRLLFLGLLLTLDRPKYMHHPQKYTTRTPQKCVQERKRRVKRVVIFGFWIRNSNEANYFGDTKKKRHFHGNPANVNSVPLRAFRYRPFCAFFDASYSHNRNPQSNDGGNADDDLHLIIN